MGGGCPRSIGERVGVLAKVGCPPSTPDNDTSVITMGGGGLWRAPTILLNRKLGLGSVKNWSFSGTLPHFSASKLRPFQF